MKVITTVVGSLQTNCYLLIDEETKSAALIDPGDEAEKLLALVKSEGVTLKYILLTPISNPRARAIRCRSAR